MSGMFEGSWDIPSTSALDGGDVRTDTGTGDKNIVFGTTSGFSWSTALILVAGLAGLWIFMRFKK